MKNLDLLIPTRPTKSDSWVWATVTGVEPLRIRLDGDPDPLPATPDCLFAGAEVGQRVWVQLSGHRVIVHAPSGGGGGGDGTPVGVMQMWPTETPPENYLILNGSTYDTNAYPELFAVLGTNVLPDMRQRFPLGGTLPADVGNIGGSSTKTLTANEMPAHSHDASHTHDISHDHGTVGTTSDTHSHGLMFETWDTTVSEGGTGVLRVTDIQNGSGGSGANHNVNVDNDSHSHNVNIPPHNGSSGWPSYSRTDTQGSGQAFDIMNPYVTVNFIIKAR